MKFLFSLSIIFFCFALRATETAKLVSFEGLVQFVDGSSFILSQGGEPSEVKYGTPIYEDTKIKVERDSNLKFVTKNNCIVVVYGEGNVLGPQGEKPWRISNTAARFLCSEKSEEKFSFHGIEITPQGEILIDRSGKIFVVTGSARVGQILTSRHIYQFAKASVALDKVQQNSQTQYDFDNLYRVPREGEKLKKPESIVPDKYRLSFGPMTGPAILLHANGYLNHYDYSTDGPRLEFAFRSEEAAWLIGVRYLESQSQNQTYNNTTTNTSDRLQTLGVDTGYRYNFDRWWSPFIRAGLTWTSNEIRINSNNGYNSDRSFNYLGVSASLGMDFLLRPSWLGGLGLFASAELELAQTLFSIASSDKFINSSGGSSAPASASDEKSFISNFNGLVSFGLLYQF